MAKKIIVLTGASSGFGILTAEARAKASHAVDAASLAFWKSERPTAGG